MKLVSIIIPVYNGEKHIQKCLDKVLKQSYPNIEIIVLNDGTIAGQGTHDELLLNCPVYQQIVMSQLYKQN